MSRWCSLFYTISSGLYRIGTGMKGLRRAPQRRMLSALGQEIRMKQRTLGASGLSVAPIMLGGNVRLDRR